MFRNVIAITRDGATFYGPLPAEQHSSTYEYRFVEKDRRRERSRVCSRNGAVCFCKSRTTRGHTGANGPTFFLGYALVIKLADDVDLVTPALRARVEPSGAEPRRATPRATEPNNFAERSCNFSLGPDFLPPDRFRVARVGGSLVPRSRESRARVFAFVRS